MSHHKSSTGSSSADGSERDEAAVSAAASDESVAADSGVFDGEPQPSMTSQYKPHHHCGSNTARYVQYIE